MTIRVRIESENHSEDSGETEGRIKVKIIFSAVEDQSEDLEVRIK